MDPNANAAGLTPEVATQVPATQTPIAEASPVVANTEATAAPVTNGLQLDEATQKYLSNQNIIGNPTEVIVELVRRNQSLRSAPKAEQPKEKVADIIRPETEVKPAATDQTSTGLSDMNIMTTQMLVERQFPDVKADAAFYKEMIADGFNPMNGNEIDLNRVFKYAGMKQKIISAEKAISAAQQPANIPSPSNTVDTSMDRIENMTYEQARGIIVMSARENSYGRNGHPQLEEAKRIVQEHTRSNKI